MSGTAPAPDLPLLRKAVEWVEAEAVKPPRQSQWLQSMWFTPAEQRIDPSCGTAYCVAGYVTELTVGVDEASECALTAEGVSIPAHAQKVLGLTYAEAASLFHAGNTPEDILAVAEKIAHRAGERL